MTVCHSPMSWLCKPTQFGGGGAGITTVKFRTGGVAKEREYVEFGRNSDGRGPSTSPHASPPRVDLGQP